MMKYSYMKDRTVWGSIVRFLQFPKKILCSDGSYAECKEHSYLLP